jgi:transcriptional regulator with XRE-family HTH domain
MNGLPTGGTTLGRWLRQQRQQRKWSQHRMARMLIEAAHAEGDSEIPGIESMLYNVYRWERGQNRPTERYRWLYCRAFGIPPAHFGPTPADALPSRILPPLRPADRFALSDISHEDTVQCLIAIRDVVTALLDTAERTLPPGGTPPCRGTAESAEKVRGGARQ